MTIMIRKFLPFLLILTLSYWAIKPLFVPGFFTIHDGVHPQRINQMEKAFKDLHIPPRWSPDLGYGYGWPQFSFYSPLPYYLGAVINLITTDVLISTKILFAFALIFSAYFMYLLVKELFGELSGIIAGMFYLYSPYHALDAYVRGALAELWGIMFIPLVLFCLVKVVKEKSFKWIVFGGFAYAGLILSHNITALIFTIFLLISLFICSIYLFIKKSKSLNYLITNYSITIVLGLFLSCYFWLPAVLESKYTHIETMAGGQFGYRAHFIAFRQIWDSPWDYGASAGIFSGLSYMVGKLHLILVGLSLILVLMYWWYKKKIHPSILFAICYLLFAIFMTNKRSDFIWSNLLFMNFIQFPWRFLIFIMFFSSFLAGTAVSFIKNSRLKMIIVGFLTVTVIYTNYSYFKPAKYLTVNQNYFLKGENFYEWGTAASEEYLPVWRPKKIVNPPKELLEIKNGSYEIIKQKVGYYQLTVKSEISQETTLNVNYFPGWQVIVDGKKVAVNYKKDGLIRFQCPQGKHEIIASFNETRLRFLANSISASTLFLLLSFFMLKLHEGSTLKK